MVNIQVVVNLIFYTNSIPQNLMLFESGFKGFLWDGIYYCRSTNTILENGRLLDKVFREFHKRVQIYHKQMGRYAGLILDNINRLAVANTSLLEFLQDVAKNAADNRSCITVFVTSKGHVPIQMLGILLPCTLKLACLWLSLLNTTSGSVYRTVCQIQAWQDRSRWRYQPPRSKRLS